VLCRLGNSCIFFSFHDSTYQWSSNFTLRHFSPGEKVSFQDQGLPNGKFRVCNTVHDRGLHGIDERLEDDALVQLDVLRSFLSNMRTGQKLLLTASIRILEIRSKVIDPG